MLPGHLFLPESCWWSLVTGWEQGLSCPDPAHPWAPSLPPALLVSLQSDCPGARPGSTLGSIASAQRFIGNNLTCKLCVAVFRIRASNSPVLGRSRLCVFLEALPSTSAPGSARERCLLLSLHCVPFRFLLFF